jgi:hypothetical protein
VGGGGWGVLPPSTFPDVPEPLQRDVVPPRGVMTDAGMVIVHDGITALWDPVSDSWRSMDPAPEAAGILVSSGPDVFSAAANARLDVATGRWQVLPASPVAVTDQVAAWTGEELVVIGLAGVTSPVGLAYDPARDSWRTLPDVPDTFGWSVLNAGWDGGRVLLVGGTLRQVVAHDPVADAWEELPDTEQRGSLSFEVTVDRAGDLPMLFMLDAIVVLDGDLWRPVPYVGIEGNPILSGSRLGAVRGPGESMVLMPAFDVEAGHVVVASLDVLAVLDVRTIPVGPITVDIPERYSLSFVTRWFDDRVVGTRLERGADSCAVDAGVYDEFVHPIGPEVTVVHDGDTRTWSRHESGQNWHYHDEDLSVVISCSDPAVSEQLARSVRFVGGES